MPLSALDNADLSALNTFGVAARARRLLTLEHADDTAEAVARLADAEPALLLGAGSNLLFAADFDGTVLRVALRGRRLVDPARAGSDRSGSTALVEAGAGEPWHELVLWSLDQGLYGLENLALIPGSVGAAPVQNIGAYGVELRERLDSVAAVSLDDGRHRRFTVEECCLGYRDSVFRRVEGRSRWLIVSVRLVLSRVPAPRLDYPALRAAFPESAALPSPRQIADAVCRIRRSKLPDPARLGNAGSFFRNPLLTSAQARVLVARHPGVPTYPDPGSSERVKVPAAWLIERCGWKGQRRGDAGVHADHALVLVNHGRASGAEIIKLANEIRASVADRFGVLLEPEVAIV